MEKRRYPTVKTCTICRIEKPVSEFYKRKDRNGRPRSKCKVCEYQRCQEWKKSNQGRVNEIARKSYWKNPERSIKYSRKWRRDNPDKKRAQSRKERQQDKLFPERWMKLRLRQRIGKALKQGWKSGSTMELLGCSMPDFKMYLESLFEVGMSWHNYGRGGWHIDHIVPCALFDLTKADHQRRCFHFSNLRPMWEKENVSRGIRGHHQFRLL